MKRAQSWIFEYIISFLIFLAALVIAISILNNSGDNSKYNSLKRDANHISGVLLTEGFPRDWTFNDVQALGLLTEGEVDVFKLREAEEVSYSNMKSLLGVTNEFFFYFENISGILELNDVCYWGFDYSGCDDILNNLKYEELSFVRRLVVLNSEIVELVVVTWR